MKAGFDFGSKSLNAVVLDDKKIVFNTSLAHNGNIEKAFKTMLGQLRDQIPFDRLESFGLTGKISVNGMKTFDPVITSVEANRYLSTGCRNIFSIGCESFYLIRLDDEFNYIDHIANSDCASGTGGFIDQQAERLGFSTAQLSRNALEYKDTPPSIATRCAVFAKSDIIHAQARGFSKEAICAGLCEGVARNVLANTVRGGDLPGEILFAGGMSKNQKIVDQLSNAFGRKIIVPENALTFNAIGAAALGQEPVANIGHISQSSKKKVSSRPQLEMNLSHYPNFEKDDTIVEDGIEVTKYTPINQGICQVYIGIDVGSTSTKAVVMDQNNDILVGLYSWTKGDPVRAVTGLLEKMNQVFAHTDLTILGVGTTGSGRELIRQVIGADEAINEITAHALGATFIDPDTDTIIEIGGQDSKFTQMKQGQVTNSVMNYVCAAGTGSFIEEQAKRLDISLDDISNMAPGQTAPYTSDRCTVYMERDLNIFLAQGWKKEQIIAAVLYSVRDNYLSKVVGKSRMGKRIYFQGATARNKALVAVFENELGTPVFVSKYCHLTGALGCAVSLKNKGIENSCFTGMDFSCDTHTETCELCPNQCELRVYKTGDMCTAWGLKCGRDYEDKKVKKRSNTSTIEMQFSQAFGSTVPSPENASIVAGIPQTLFMKEYTGLFTDFFHRLGIKIKIENSSDKKLAKGMEMINADFCAPMALAHGMVSSLAQKKVDFIFFPTLINEQHLTRQLPAEELFREKMTDAYFCYYSSYAPSIIDNLPAHPMNVPVVAPKLKFNNVSDEDAARTLAEQLAPVTGLSKEKIIEAFVGARQKFYAAQEKWKEDGSRIIGQSKEKMKILLIGRPYALFDPRINLGIPKKLEQMGFDLISQSMLEATPDSTQIEHMENMHWYFGQQVLCAADLVAKSSDIYPVFLTCFRCSPDAYLITYFKEIMEKADKPYLVLQLDEHSSDVGYMTRIEAAADAFINDFNQSAIEDAEPDARADMNAAETLGPDHFKEGDTVLIPTTDLRINRFQQQVFEAAGYSAQILELDSAIMNQGYRFASGGECLPNVAITGSVIHALQAGTIDPDNTILYLPNI
ncbi:MAG: acyl-CoA dehydratase activase, partial [Desulfobacterales bacterium]|nr:acyl-CoA dehydratase activase [Desulfobacterales bacterium]